MVFKGVGICYFLIFVLLYVSIKNNVLDMRKPDKHFNYIMAFHYILHLKPPHFDKRCPHILKIESSSYFHMLNLPDSIECALIQEFMSHTII